MCRRLVFVLSLLLMAMVATITSAQDEFPGVSIEFLPLVETPPGPSTEPSPSPSPYPAP